MTLQLSNQNNPAQNKSVGILALTNIAAPSLDLDRSILPEGCEPRSQLTIYVCINQ